MAILNIHNAVASCSVLVEYRGTPSAVVLLLPFGVQNNGLGKHLGDVTLGLAANQSLQAWANYTVDTLVGNIQLLPVRTVLTDTNGFGFAVVAVAHLLSAGDSLRVEATEIA